MRISNALYRGVVALSATALAVMVVLVAFQIIGRYVPFIPRALWTEELSRMCLVWLVFLGAAAGVRTSEHFLIDLIPAHLSDAVQRAIATVGLLLVAVVSVAIVFGAVGFVGTGLHRTSTTSGISLAYSFAAPLVSGVLMVAFTVEAWWGAMRDPQHGGLRNREAEVAAAQAGESA